MAIFWGLIGIGVGWLITVASEWLPRFASAPPPVPKRIANAPAFWQALSGERLPRWHLYLTVEIITGLLFAVTYIRFGMTELFWVTLVGEVVFLLIGLIDIKYRLILDVVVVPTTLLFLIVNVLLLHQIPVHAILGGALAFSIFFLTAWLKPNQLGFGDIKLALMIGVTFGFPGVLWALLVGAGAGGVVAVYMLTTRRGVLTTTVPYAPFLCFGAVVILLVRPLIGIA